MFKTDKDVLTKEEIVKIIKEYKASDLYLNYVDNLRYYTGNNPHIMDRQTPDPNAPDNKIPVSYGRKIINTVTGYMFKAGLINYGSEDEAYLNSLTEVFDANREPIKTEQMGKQTSTQGVGYEFHYVDGMILDGQTKAVPKFIKLPVIETIPVYDYSIEPTLTAFIRFYMMGDEMVVFVYYKTDWIEYRKKKDGKDMVPVAAGVHPYGQVPLVVFDNNEEKLGDFDSVTPLIDAYDVLLSDSMNEFDRFAWAYLILKGFTISPENAAAVKAMRIFELKGETDMISFLTKDINSEFIKFMAEWIRGEIHQQSGIPNLDDTKWGGNASGETVTKFIYMMELFTDPKESYFKEGLYQRIRLITNILEQARKPVGEPFEVDILMTRNKPDNSLEQAMIFEKLDGRLSRKTLIENYAPAVKNADDELDRIKEEGLNLADPEFDTTPRPSDEDN